MGKVIGVAMVAASLVVAYGYAWLTELTQEQQRQARYGAENAKTANTLLSVIVRQHDRGEALSRLIPRGCPQRVEARLWHVKVETWRTETVRALEGVLFGLGAVFAVDQANYPHTCRVEWVRARLGYFTDTLRTMRLSVMVSRR